MPIDEKTIEETTSYVAIQRLLAAYADAVNRRAWGDFNELFTADAHIEIVPSAREPLQVTGPESLGTFIGSAIEGFEFFQFVILNSRIEFQLDEDVARGRNFMCELRQDRASGKWTQVFGVYHDRFRRIDGRWWFTHRNFNALAAKGRDHAIFEFPESFHSLSNMK